MVPSITKQVFVVLILCILQRNSYSQKLIPKCYSPEISGQCVHRLQQCPPGTRENSRFSQFYSCDNFISKCCVGETRDPDPVQLSQPTSPSGEACGTGSLEDLNFIQDRVLNGVQTGPCDWPWTVSIRGPQDLQNPIINLQNTQHLCSGVLIDRNWVLTNPFCIFTVTGSSADLAPNRMLVVAAEYRVNVTDRDIDGNPQEQAIRVEKAFIHPAYRYTNFQQLIPFDDVIGISSNALALLKLREPINGKCSGVICMTTETDERILAAKSYDNCVYTGWGFSTPDFDPPRAPLLQGFSQLTSRIGCDQLTNLLNFTSFRPAGTNCMGPRITGAGTDSCLGDEGGAVMCSDNGVWYVQAIIPYNLCAQDRFNLWVTDVVQYLPWIRQTIAQNP